MKKKSCIIFSKVDKTIRGLPDEAEQARAYKAYIDFAMYGEEYSGESQIIKCILNMAREDVEKADEKYREKVERAQHAAQARHERAEAERKEGTNNKKPSGYRRAKNMFTETIEKSNTDYDAIAKERGLPLTEGKETSAAAEAT